MPYSVPVIMTFVTFGILVSGIVLMVLGNKLNITHSTRLMCLRVASQAIVVLLIALVYFLQKN